MISEQKKRLLNKDEKLIISSEARKVLIICTLIELYHLSKEAISNPEKLRNSRGKIREGQENKKEKRKKKNEQETENNENRNCFMEFRNNQGRNEEFDEV